MAVGQPYVECDVNEIKECSNQLEANRFDLSTMITTITLTSVGSSGFSQFAEEVIYELFKSKTSFVGGGTVNLYFYQAFLDIWNGGMRDDFLTLKNANPGFELWVTGHSLGAAMASLCAGYIAYMGYIPGDKIKLVTYGQPRTGDLAYANYIDNTVLGTRGSQGWLQVADEVIYEMFKNKTSFVGGGTVNVYFYQAFLDIWNAGMRDDFLTLKNANPGFELWVTGHSLGAAMASLCAGYIAAMGYIPGNKIKLVTYGQPRTGDLAYANYIDNTIWYNNNMAVGQPYIECDVNESNQCSDQLEANIFDLKGGDHDYYFNVSTGFAVNGCPNYNPGRFIIKT
uniref:Fungal lipase-like domain-containing protein n=1 Tax=Acrobeloides nanus TaxID=290746 RepID=A0A914EHC4_9BILA